MNFDITILGNNSAMPTSNRFPTAQYVNVRQRHILLDCGEGTQMQLRKFRLPINKINHICITHLHGDHYFGLIGLISTLTLLKRKGDLHIYSHSELQTLLKPQLDYLKEDLTFRIVFHPINFKKPQLVWEDKAIEIISFPMKHRISCCGFKIIEKKRPDNIKKEMIKIHDIPLKEIPAIKSGADFTTETGRVIPNSRLVTAAPKPRSYVFCGDTAYTETILPTIEGCNLLYHEATFTEELAGMAKLTYHSTAKQAATIAAKANVDKLIIGHFSARYHSTTPILKEAQQHFKNTEEATEGKCFSIAIKK
ncbi:ribonuclease Z [Puteibacter caeruleilacunae]|nr:ribonuclease Z [Puteibacter caeruleilacunae]